MEELFQRPYDLKSLIYLLSVSCRKKKKNLMKRTCVNEGNCIRRKERHRRCMNRVDIRQLMQGLAGHSKGLRFDCY